MVRYRTYEVLKEEVANPQLRWAYLPYSMHMAGPREAIQVRPYSRISILAVKIQGTTETRAAAASTSWR